MSRTRFRPVNKNGVFVIWDELSADSINRKVQNTEWIGRPGDPIPVMFMSEEDCRAISDFLNTLHDLLIE